MKLRILAISTFFLGLMNAQSISTSPYSGLGIGDVLFDNTAEQAAMAGLNVAVESPFYASANFTNPAANRNLYLTSFEFGVNSDLFQYEAPNGVAKNSSTYVSKLSLAFPINEKTKAGFGFQPYSADGYDIVNTTTVTDGPDVQNIYEGDGGLNTLHFILSRNLTPELSVGAKVNYLFGTIDRSEQIITEGVDLLTDYSYSNESNGFQFSASAFYSKKLKNDNSLNVGLNYVLGTKLNSDVTDLVTTYFPINTIPTNLDTIRIVQQSNADTKLPQEISLGVSYTKNADWLIGAQFDFGNWSDFELAGGQATDNTFNNSFRAAVGGYWLPNNNSYKSYLARITYRAGLYYEDTPLQISGTDINQYGITFGMSLPVGKGQDTSKLDLAAEFGQRGTTSNNLIRESFAKLKLGLTLNARWFQKRIYE